MTRPKSRRQRHGPGTLFDKGVAAAVVGLGLVLAPGFLGASPVLSALREGMRPAGWLSLGLGLALVALHIALTGNKLPKTKPPTAQPDRREPRGLQEMPNDAATASADEDDYASGPPSVWSPSVFEDIEWRRFEALCETLFAQAGLETRAQSHGADAGASIWLHSRHAEGPVAVVRCRHLPGAAVGVDELRAFLSLMKAHWLRRGTFATSGWFSAEALHFARKNRINALDGEALLNMISHRTPEQQRALLKVMHEGEFWRPTCVNCGTKMVERMPVLGGAPFWACAGFPRCRARLPMATL